MTLAIAHAESGERAVLDLVAERKPPFSPDGVVEEFAGILKQYRIGTVRSDRYDGEWPKERFLVHGISSLPAEKTRSELYLAFLPLLNSGRVTLLDNQRMVAQFVGLERRTSRAGKDTVDHAPGSHDDLANSVAGAIVLAAGENVDVLAWAKLLAVLPLSPVGEPSPPPALPWHRSAQATRAPTESDGFDWGTYNQLSQPKYVCNSCGTTLAPLAARITDGEHYWCSRGCAQNKVAA
jgi:hypothetical protein